MSLNKILAAFYPIRVEGCRFFIQQALDWDFLCEVDEIYDDFIQQNRFDLLTRQQIKTTLIQRGIISPNIDKELEVAQKQIGNNQEKMFLSREHPIEVKKLRRRLKTIRDSIHSTLFLLSKYYRYSLEDYGEVDKKIFILENTLFDANMKKTSPSGELSPDRCFFYLSIEDVRRIARSDPWKSIWATKKGAAFQYSPLTDNQISLSQYSRFYENVYKSIDNSLYHIIDDDDMLDGYQIFKNKEGEGDTKNKTAAHKHNNVFEFVKSKEELEEVHASNTPMAANIMAARQKQIKSSGGKPVEHNDLHDVRMSNAARRLQR